MVPEKYVYRDDEGTTYVGSSDPGTASPEAPAPSPEPTMPPPEFPTPYPSPEEVKPFDPNQSVFPAPGNINEQDALSGDFSLPDADDGFSSAIELHPENPPSGESLPEPDHDHLSSSLALGLDDF